MRYHIRYISCIVAACSLCFGCSTSNDDAPPERSSLTFSTDGTHRIGAIGVPGNSSGLSLSVPANPTSAPLALVTHDSETYVVAQGNYIVIGSPLSSRILTRSSDSSDITELLCDSSFLYAIHFNGTVEQFDKSGKIGWHSSIHRMPRMGAILTSKEVIVSTDSAIMAFASNDGSPHWSYPSSLAPQSLCYDRQKGLLYAALTANNPDGFDSIVCFAAGGSVVSHTGFAQTRITSNIMLCPDGQVAFGYLGAVDEKAKLRAGHVCLWAGLSGSSTKMRWDHTLPYVVTSVCSNDRLIISGGFRESAGDLVSGIDAFSLTDTAKIWQRRFSYALVSPVTVSPTYAYVPFTFATSASLPAKTIVVTIDLTDGSTASEVAAGGAQSGFVQGVGMPSAGMLLYADRSAPRIYFLKP